VIKLTNNSHFPADPICWSGKNSQKTDRPYYKLITKPLPFVTDKAELCPTPGMSQDPKTGFAKLSEMPYMAILIICSNRAGTLRKAALQQYLTSTNYQATPLMPTQNSFVTAYNP